MSTLKNKVYAQPFPSHDFVLKFILKLPETNPCIDKIDAMEFYAEMGTQQYNGMKAIFENRGDAKITRQVGQMLYDSFRDKRQMWAVFYTYLHLIAYMTAEIGGKGNAHVVYDITTNVLNRHWDGIGDEKYGWRN